MSNRRKLPKTREKLAPGDKVTIINPDLDESAILYTRDRRERRWSETMLSRALRLGMTDDRSA